MPDLTGDNLAREMIALRADIPIILLLAQPGEARVQLHTTAKHAVQPLAPSTHQVEQFPQPAQPPAQLVQCAEDAVVTSVSPEPFNGKEQIQGWLEEMIADDFFMNGSLTSRSRVPNLLAAVWTLGRESMLVDDQLALVLGCCHPALAPDAQVALTLRVVAGLSTAQIARAFLDQNSRAGDRSRIRLRGGCGTQLWRRGQGAC